MLGKALACGVQGGLSGPRDNAAGLLSPSPGAEFGAQLGRSDALSAETC